MHKKSLIETNPYLKDHRRREEMFCTSTSSSTAIEGVHITAAELAKAEETLFEVTLHNAAKSDE
ncbi:MAG: hypothetical protein OEV59_09785 [Deltaproteobacteria bacterium]|nr:hypothetical protein [Deltaproteobacteria bacterium]